MSQTGQDYITNLKNKVKKPQYIFTGFAIVLYVYSVSIMLKHSPFTNACLNTKGVINGGMVFVSAITSLVALGIMFIFTINSGMSHIPLLVMFILTAISVCLGVFYFLRCSKLNPDIIEKLSENNNIKELGKKYSEITAGILPLSKCTSYHTGDYYKNNDTVCRAIQGCSDADVCDLKNGAKLVDFYVASSHQSCNVPLSSGNYVSIEMLKTVLDSGVRLLDFDIYTEVVNGDVIPVVRSSWRNKTSQNYIPIEDVWDAISSYAFLKHNGDPLLVHLNLKTNNIAAIDQIAKTYVSTLSGDNILEPRFSYLSSRSVAKEPICSLYNKVILIVTGETSHTLLDELVNLHTSHNARLLNASAVETPSEPKSFAYSNQNMYTIVKPNEWELNTNPEKAWTHGVQGFMMNYWNYSKLMESYCKEFENSSFKMKSLSLQQDRISPKKVKASPMYKTKVEKSRTESLRQASQKKIEKGL
tara:strand:+ start:5483 stop:6901 length:1419 start_codon:yes stop_codon:yes gene_type:complete